MKVISRNPFLVRFIKLEALQVLLKVIKIVLCDFVSIRPEPYRADETTLIYCGALSIIESMFYKVINHCSEHLKNQISTIFFINTTDNIIDSLKPKQSLRPP
jgi:hypothetical protein